MECECTSHPRQADPNLPASRCSCQFSQNPQLRRELLATEGTVLAEANPRDTIWGIGLGASNPKAQTKRTWRGRNLLGYTLTRVRDRLIGEGGSEATLPTQNKEASPQ